MDLFGRKARRAAEIRELLASDLDAGAARLTAEERRLEPAEARRLTEEVRRLETAREHREYLSRSLAEGTISPTAAFELLETYQDAGYVSAEQFDMLRRHTIEAHRRELTALLADPESERQDYFRLLDGYRGAGYLGEADLGSLQDLVDAKLRPDLAARRLIASAEISTSVAEQIRLFGRYLTEFEGFEDYAKAASMYLSLRLHELWETLPRIRFALQATAKVQEMNILLEAYLPHSTQIERSVPIVRIVSDFHGLAHQLRPHPDIEKPIAAHHVGRRVMVAEKSQDEPGTYRHERNALIPTGSKGKIEAADGLVVVRHDGPEFEYSRRWRFESFEGTEFEFLPREGPFAVWAQSEIGFFEGNTPSPVLVHQFREAVNRMEALLEAHSADSTVQETDG